MNESTTSEPRTRWSAVWLIYAREMRDQLRDRRTLFTIAVLPILLYPIVGTLLLQIAQFTRTRPTSIAIVGVDNLGDAPELLNDDGFRPEMADPSGQSGATSRWDVTTFQTEDLGDKSERIETVSAWVRYGRFDLALVIPEGFAGADEPTVSAPAMRMYFHVGSDASMVARSRIEGILNRWRHGWVGDRLDAVGVSRGVLDPFAVAPIDVAPRETQRAAFWSKLLPFVMLIWAMTGAFYPAIDLVAGEKERGTLETILSSPATRGEIVWGKLAAVTTFSIMTAILNAISMLITSSFVMKQIQIAGAGGGPPIGPLLWMLVALLPLAALFSATALAVAAMAQSSKEGQYYLMPLMMLVMPLVMLPMLPGTTLSLGTSLIPVTGMFLLVRSLVEGQYGTAMFYAPVVGGVTLGCLYVAARWARRQFDSESVLFGGGDGFDLSQWMRHLWRDRQSYATPTQAAIGGAVILVALFFGRLAATTMPTNIGDLAVMIVLPQLGLILAPVLLMATMLTTSLRTSLRLRMPHWTTLPLALVLGAALHPSYVMLAGIVKQLYPISTEAAASMKPMVDTLSTAPWWTVVLLMAMVPAICEELAFRGFIFGGLVRGGGRFRAVLVTALIFGISHGVLQQSISATVMGLLLGWVTLKTGSVLPCIVVHITNNALSISMQRIVDSGWPVSKLMLQARGDDIAYHPLWFALSIPMAITILLYFDMVDSPEDRTARPSSEPNSSSLDGSVLTPWRWGRRLSADSPTG